MGRQAQLFGQAAHLGLAQAAQREAAVRQGFAVDLMQKIGLVFVPVQPLVQGVAVACGFNPRIVAGGDLLGT